MSSVIVAVGGIRLGGLKKPLSSVEASTVETYVKGPSGQVRSLVPLDSPRLEHSPLWVVKFFFYFHLGFF